MGVTIKVNGLFNSLVHKGSTGVAMSTVPDVCKTPSPSGPVPIPYPVIVSMSSDLVKGTKTVKVDGRNPAAVKGSEFSRCSGDEPGTLGGVVSSTNMREAKWILYSFDVKMDGKNACRLMDKMTMNHQNTVCLAGVIQGPVVPVDMRRVGRDQDAACKQLEKKRVKDEDHKAAAKRAGMREKDYERLREFSDQRDVCVSFRQTNPAGTDKIGKYPCKPMSCKKSTEEDGLTPPPPPIYTGDYDMHDLISNKTGRQIKDPRWQSRYRNAMNNAMEDGKKFPRIMHGPQSTFGSWIQKNPATKAKWQKTLALDKETKKPYTHPEKHPRAGEYVTEYDKIREKYVRPGATPEEPVTVFDDGKVYQLESNEDVLNFYRCKGEKPPSEWKFTYKSKEKRVKK
jgi:hypothetical protein